MTQQSATEGGLLAGYLTEAQTAKELDKTPRTLSAWRKSRQGPPFVKIGPTVLYPQDGIRAWLKSLTVDPARRGKQPA
jgi:hypothetical protein